MKPIRRGTSKSSLCKFVRIMIIRVLTAVVDDDDEALLFRIHNWGCSDKKRVTKHWWATKTTLSRAKRGHRGQQNQRPRTHSCMVMDDGESCAALLLWFQWNDNVVVWINRFIETTSPRLSPRGEFGTWFSRHGNNKNGREWLHYKFMVVLR